MGATFSSPEGQGEVRAQEAPAYPPNLSLKFLLVSLWVVSGKSPRPVEESGMPGPGPGGHTYALEGCWDLNWRPLSRTKPPCHSCEPVSPFKRSERWGGLGHLPRSCPQPTALSGRAFAPWMLCAAGEGTPGPEGEGSQWWFGTGCAPAWAPQQETPPAPHWRALPPEGPQAQIPISIPHSSPLSRSSIPRPRARGLPVPTARPTCPLSPTARPTHQGCIRDLWPFVLIGLC